MSVSEGRSNPQTRAVASGEGRRGGASGLGGVEIDDEADDDCGLEGDFQDRLAAAFDPPGNGRMRSGEQTAGALGNGEPVVADEPGEQAAAAGLREEIEGKPALARARGAADQEARLADRQRRRVDIGAGRRV